MKNRRSRKELQQRNWKMDSDNRFRRTSVREARRLYEGLRICRRLGIDHDHFEGDAAL